MRAFKYKLIHFACVVGCANANANAYDFEFCLSFYKRTN